MEPENKPFYTSWLFWILVILAVVLGISVYFLVNTYIAKPLILETQGSGESVRVHVTTLRTSDGGFLVLRAGTSDSPGGVLTVSPYIFSGTYDNFFLQFIRDVSDRSDNSKYYSDLDYELKNKFYAIFYKDANKNGIYEENIDTEVPIDIFGRRLQVVIVNGKQLL